MNIAHCEWSDRNGRFAARADWNSKTNTANFEARSSLNLKTFLDAFDLGGPFAGAEFQSPPLVEISGSKDLHLLGTDDPGRPSKHGLDASDELKQQADVIAIHIYQNSFVSWNFGVGSAMSVLLLLFLLVISCAYLLITNRRRH